MLLKLDTVHLFSLDWPPFLCGRCIIRRCCQCVSPFSFKCWCLQSKSGFCTLNSTLNLKLHYSIFYRFLHRRYSLLKPSSLRLAPSVFQPDHRLLHGLVWSSGPSSALGDRRRLLLLALCPSAVVGGGWGHS